MKTPIKTWPEEIFLQAGDDDLEEYSQYSEVTWCEDPACDTNVRYIRADLASPPLPLQGGEQVGPLPELPVPELLSYQYDSVRAMGIQSYSVRQMIAYGRACIAAVSPQGGEAKAGEFDHLTPAQAFWKGYGDAVDKLHDEHKIVVEKLQQKIIGFQKERALAAPAVGGEAKAAAQLTKTESGLWQLFVESHAWANALPAGRHDLYAAPVAQALPVVETRDVTSEALKIASKYRKGAAGIYLAKDIVDAFKSLPLNTNAVALSAPNAALPVAAEKDALDAKRYRFARDNIKEGHELPGGFYLADKGAKKTWDKTIDAAIAQKSQPSNIGEPE